MVTPYALSLFRKKMKIKLFFILLSVASFAQIPSYYSGVDFTQSATSVKSQLTNLITTTHTTELVYTSGSSGFLDTWTVLKASDLDPVNSANVLLLYGWNNESATVSEERTRDSNESCHTSSCAGKWVREHTFPKSLGNPNLGTQFAGADAHNLRAIDAQRNGSRSNKLYGAAPASTPSYSINSNSWYPGDEWIGDVARIIMYMHLRYPNQCNANNAATGGSTFAPFNDMPDILLQWNAQDPPSTFEINRNYVIEYFQGNRNPFIDNPYLATQIWNGPQAIDSWNVLSNNSLQENSFTVYPTITNSTIHIKTNKATDYKVAIYNSTGQLVLINSKDDSLDLSGQSNGLYFIRITDQYTHQTFKVIKN
jgi:endonuclease I